jgi:L-histidine N-alpha-methyltransferase
MTGLAHIGVDPSQFPDRVRRSLTESLRERIVNHKFHYDSIKQTQKWLALHEAYSPARTDPDAVAIYDQAFEAMVKLVRTKNVHVIGLGCGGGKKDTRLLQLLAEAGKEIWYSPVDVSSAMVLVARQTALSLIRPERCFPLVCDLSEADDLGSSIAANSDSRDALRLVTFFGMLPNFEPEIILPKLAGFVGSDDLFLLSANLAPGNDYSSGVAKVLPLYDNQQTREWLMTFLLDLGVERSDGELRFAIEARRQGKVELQRIVAFFHFSQSRLVEIDQEKFQFNAGEVIRLFFSYRHTPSLLPTLLASHQLDIRSEWITQSGEEGVFAARRS